MAKRKKQYGYTPETHRERAKWPVGGFRRMERAFKTSLGMNRCADALYILHGAIAAQKTFEIERTYAVSARGAAGKRTHYRRASPYVSSGAMGSKVDRMETAYLNKCVIKAKRK